MNEDNTLNDFVNPSSPKNQETKMQEADRINSLVTALSLTNLIQPSESKIKESIPKYDLDTVCGIGCFSSPYLQPWASARVYLVLYSIVGILNEGYPSYLIGVMSTLEKRFAFKSQISGWILVMDGITSLLLGVLVGYLGGRIPRPRMVAYGNLLSALGCFICALPYFLYGADTNLISASIRNSTEFSGCQGKSEECDADARPPTIAAIMLLMLGSFLTGCGKVPCYTVGMAYMDDNVEKKNTPMYFGFITTSWMLGPSLGYLMSYSFLKYHEDPSTDPGFGPENTLWIGRWWAGFVLQGVLLLVLAAPFGLFPRRLSGRTIRKEEKIHLNGLWAAIKILSRNQIFILLMIYETFHYYCGYLYNMMLPKYMENQFRLSAAEASLFSGTPAFSALMVAHGISGYLIYKFQPNAKFLTGGLTVLQVIRAIGFIVLMIPKCDIIQMSSYGFDEQGLILEGPCNSNCSCSTNVFSPICASDGKTVFFSPCYAGCHLEINETFAECSCLDSYDLEENHPYRGFCIDHGCWTQALVYTITLPITVSIVHLLIVAHHIIRLRCIKTEEKSVALGMFEAVTSLFALLPVVFGAIVDSECLVWQKSCGETGNCWFYDIAKFNYLMHGISALFAGFAAISMFSMFRRCTRMNDLYKDD